ncbi:inorganic diphosphatase [Streptomyces sp. NPDC058385]|uniref:inorganic diphosphatase n=1 Tax=Streptomyces sp. NPDC058385 TaxID=3346473 RepID=UPI0036591282
MSRIAVAVDATVASTIKRDGESVEPLTGALPAHGTDGWPVGHGLVTNTLGDDGRPLEALVLMCEPAIPQGEIAAWPVALLHLTTRGRTIDEVLCVAEVAPFTDLVDVVDLPRWHARPEAWATALACLIPGSAYQIAGLGPAREADELLDTARHAYFQLTGCLE